MVEKIHELYKQVNFESLGEDIIALASDLMYSCPDLAINLVEKSKFGLEGGNILDWALARLALESLKVSSEDGKDTLADDIDSKIKDKRIKGLIKGINYLTDKSTINDLIEIIKSFENPSEKLFLLRNWLRLNREKPNTEQIVRLALDIVIEATEYVPNASVLRDLAITLPNIDNEPALNTLIDDFDSLKESVKQKGPTRDFIAFNLLLAEGELKSSEEKCINRLYEIYYFIDEIDDISTKTDALSLFLRKINKLNEKNQTIKSENFIDDVLKSLKINIEIILNDCAYHYEAFNGIIRNLSLTNEPYTDLAVELALKLNTAIHRDSAILDIFDNYFNNNELNKINFDFIDKLYKNLHFQKNRSTLIIELLEQFLNKSNETKSILPKVETYIEKIDIIIHSIDRCYALVRAYLILIKDATNYTNLIDKIKTRLLLTWESLDYGWERVEIAYKIASDLAAGDSILAKEYLNIAEHEKSKSYLDSPSTASIFISTLKLAVRAFSGLSSSVLSDEASFLKLKDYIDQIPSTSIKLTLWADCALRLKKRKEEKLFNKIVEEEIKSKLAQLNDMLPGDESELIIKIAPALFCHHSDNALEFIQNKVHSDYIDHAHDDILDFILTKCSIEDPCEYDNNCNKLSIEEVTDCCKLIEKLSTDNMIYFNVKNLIDVMCNDENHFTKQQIDYTAGRLEKVIHNNLPDKNNIKHDGYIIVLKAQVLRLKKSKFDRWEPLLEATIKIPNLSDRVIIQYEILEALAKTHNKYEEPKKSIVQKSMENLEQIPIFNERVRRYSEFLQVLKLVDRKLCESKLKTLFEQVVGVTDHSLLDAQKKLIDYAYKLDPKLAESLISKIDTDPARGILGVSLENHYNLLKLRSEVFEGNDPDKHQLSQVSAMLLESLNSGKLGTKSLRELNSFVRKISQSSLKDSLPISTYYVQNAVTKYQFTPHANSAIRKIFEATLFTAHLVGYLSKKYSKTTFKYVPTLTNITPEVNIFKKGEREKAICFLEEWLQSTSFTKIDICDAYFDITELNLLKLISSINNRADITILTGMKHNEKFIADNGNENTLICYWNDISIEKPPKTKVILVGVERNLKPPFHDRWWILNNGETGLRIGTSFNSIGLNKDSEISILKDSEAQSIYSKIMQEYGYKNERYYKEDKLIYKIFVL